MFNTDPNRSVEEILIDIRQGAVNAASQSHLNLVGSVLAPFSALLVRRGRDAGKNSQEVAYFDVYPALCNGALGRGCTISHTTL
jgi:hypothetical protein